VSTVHLVVTTSDLKGIITVEGVDGWHLPRVEASNQTSRLSLAALLRTTLDQLTPAELVCWSPLPAADGGLTHDQYCVAVARTATLNPIPCAKTFIVSREQLLADGMLSQVEQSAVRTAVSRLETPMAIFDSQPEVSEALAWGECAFAEVTGARVLTPTRYRNTRHDLVVRFEFGGDAAFLKAGPGRVPDEAVLTQHLWILRPHQFPETIALDRNRYRWLYRELRGTSLASSLTRTNILAAVRAVASLQRETLTVSAIADHLAHRRRSVAELFHEVDAVVRHTWRSVPPKSADGMLLSAWNTVGEGIMRTCIELDSLGIPSALVLSDLSVENVLVTQHGIGFIDVGNSYWSHPILPMWRFIRDSELHLEPDDPRRGSTMRQAIVETFTAVWANAVPPQSLRRAFDHLWLIGRLFSILMRSHGVDRYQEALGYELPAGYRASCLAGRVRSLLRSFAERSLMPRVTEPDAASALDLR
jgi:hypothetical protein